MVTKQDILKLVANPHGFNAEDVNTLKDLKKQYPYFSLLDMLLTKAYYDNDSLEYHLQLKKTAVSVPDREMLYLLIHEEKEEEVVEEIVADKPNLEEEKPILESNPTQVEAPIDSEQPETKVENNIQEEQVVLESNQAKEESDDVSKVEEEVKEEKRPSKIEDLIKDKKDSLDDLILSSAMGSYQLVDDEEEEKQEETQEEKVVNEIKEEPKEMEDVPKNFFHWLTPSDEGITYKEVEAPSIDELVDKFLKNKDSERLSPKPFFSAEDKAKQSVKEDEDFVTETLANIYLKQKKYEKAKEAFQKLILKNPEKKPYFVDQIDQIDQLLNN